MLQFDVTYICYILMLHFDETYLCCIWLLHFDITFGCYIWILHWHLSSCLLLIMKLAAVELRFEITFQLSYF